MAKGKGSASKGLLKMEHGMMKEEDAKRLLTEVAATKAKV